MSRTNGNGSGKPVHPPPADLHLTERLAASIADGCAASCFDFVGSVDGAKGMPRGRFWYLGGEAVDVELRTRIVEGLAMFCADHAGVGPDAVFLQLLTLTAGTDAGRKRAKQSFETLPFHERQAFGVFASVAGTLMPEARREAGRRRQADADARSSAPPPNRGAFKRTRVAGGRLGRRLTLTHKAPAREAAE